MNWLDEMEAKDPYYGGTKVNAPDIGERHSPEYGGDGKCAIHDEDEWGDLAKAYTQCIECGHVYATAQAVIVRFLELLRGIGKEAPDVITAEQVLYCPWCLHDW